MRNRHETSSVYKRSAVGGRFLTSVRYSYMDTTEVAKLIRLTGLKKQEVATYLGVSVATLRRWQHASGSMPNDKLHELMTIAGKVPPRSLTTLRPPALALAQIPSSALIEELARRTRAGQLRDSGLSEL